MIRRGPSVGRVEGRSHAMGSWKRKGTAGLRHLRAIALRQGRNKAVLLYEGAISPICH